MPQTVDWAIDMLDQAQEVTDIVMALRSSARASVGADGVTVVLREGDMCHYVEEDAVGPLWKGKRFPIRQCISGWAMLNDLTVVIPDVHEDERIPQEAYRPTFVRSMAMVPIGSPPISAIGAYWSTEHAASTAELHPLQRLATAAGAAFSRLGVTSPASQPDGSKLLDV